MNLKKSIMLIVPIAVIMIIAGIGYDLSQFSAGYETPDDVMLAEILDGKTAVSPPPLITTYPSFSVLVEDDISIDVHMRETPNATENIFMVHGAGGGSWAWEEYFDHFPEKYNLYALSWRGHFTSSPVDDADTSDHARDQIAVIDTIAQRNDLPIHVIGHSFGGATSTLAASQSPDRIQSLHLVAPVVPKEFSFLQSQILPAVMPAMAENVFGEIYTGMFLDEQQMERYYDLYAGKPFSAEKLGLFKDGMDPDWQVKLESAYKNVGESGLPVWLLVAQYDNSVVPGHQIGIANESGIPYIELQSGHYIQLDVQTDESISIILDNLDGISNSIT